MSGKTERGRPELGSRPVVTALRVLIPFALGYFLSYVYRVVNAVIAPDLVAELGLTAADLGLLTSVYLLTFAAFQLPLGVLLDRFAPRKVEAWLLVFAAAGAFVFSSARTAPGLAVGRALIGFGVSACLMAAFRAFVVWFPRERLPLVNGVLLAFGGLGALAATAPVEAALAYTDWRGIFRLVGFATLLTAAAVALAVPRDRESTHGVQLSAQLRGVAQVFGSREFWRVTPLTVGSQAAFLAVQGLWAGPWLRDVAGLDRGEAAWVLLLLAAAMTAGYLGLGTLAERAGRRGWPTEGVAVGGMVGFLLVLAVVAAGWAGAPAPLWVLFGFFGTSGVVSYAALTQAFPPTLAGRVNTALNLLVFVAAFGVQWGLGALIGLWPAGPGGGYAPEGYRVGFGVLLAVQVAGVLWYAAACRDRRGRGKEEPPW